MLNDWNIWKKRHTFFYLNFGLHLWVNVWSNLFILICYANELALEQMCADIFHILVIIYIQLFIVICYIRIKILIWNFTFELFQFRHIISPFVRKINKQEKKNIYSYILEFSIQSIQNFIKIDVPQNKCPFRMKLVRWKIIFSPYCAIIVA